LGYARESRAITSALVIHSKLKVLSRM
jgi:hypothetical protein